MELPSHVRSRSLDTNIFHTFVTNTPPGTPKSLRGQKSNSTYNNNLSELPPTSEVESCDNCHKSDDCIPLNCHHMICKSCRTSCKTEIFKDHSLNCPLCHKKLGLIMTIKHSVVGVIKDYLCDHLASRLYDMKNDEDFKSTTKVIEERWKVYNVSNREYKTMPSKLFKNLRYIVMGLLILCAGLQWTKQNYGDTKPVKIKSRSMPLEEWHTNQVKSWVVSLGPWTHKGLLTMVDSSNIDGLKLRGMTRTHLYMSMSNYAVADEHKAAFIDAVEALVKQHSVPVIRNFWDYKEKNLGRTLFILYSLPRYTRLTILYLYIFDHQHSFIPLVQLSSGQSFYTLTSTKGRPLSSMDHINFWLSWVFIPTLPIAQAMWRVKTFNKALTSLVVVWASTITVAEIYALFYALKTIFKILFKSNKDKKFEDDSTPKISSVIDKVFMYHGIVLAGYIVWPIIPTFICSAYIYVKFWFSVPLMILSALLLQFLIVKKLFTWNQEKYTRSNYSDDYVGVDGFTDAGSNNSEDYLRENIDPNQPLSNISTTQQVYKEYNHQQTDAYIQQTQAYTEKQHGFMQHRRCNSMNTSPNIGQIPES